MPVPAPDLGSEPGGLPQMPAWLRHRSRSRRCENRSVVCDDVTRAHQAVAPQPPAPVLLLWTQTREPALVPFQWKPVEALVLTTS
jgi:hypothetical protein